jgi:hypothetical protein
LRGQYVEAADPTQLKSAQVAEYLRSHDTNPQTGERPRPHTNNQFSKIANCHPGSIKAL